MTDLRAKFEAQLAGPDPILALAPMQDVTDLAFWTLLGEYGGADLYFTEYFRVYATSVLDKHIVKSITRNPTGRPVVAQIIGNDIPALVSTARELQQLPIVAVDLNLGCPAPIVYRKSAGGGLLRNLPHVDAVLGALRGAISIKFSVKTRIGFDSPADFEELLKLLAKHSPDLVTIHGRTVRQMYRGEVRYDLISQAARYLPCPVLANGDINSAVQASDVLRQTGAYGLMLGRGAIRNPWLFQQIRQLRAGQPIFVPTGNDVLEYIQKLYNSACSPGAREHAQVQRLKKHLSHIAEGVGPQFLHQIRRVATKADFFNTCDRYLAHDHPLILEPCHTLSNTDKAFPSGTCSANAASP